MNIGLRNLSLTVLGGMLFTFCGGLPAEAGDLRIATYNVRADTGSPDGGPGLTTVLQGIGNAILPDGNAQPVDVLALEELNYNNPSPSSTLQFIVSQLNAIYGAGTYAFDPVVDPTDGNTTGNGPSGLIYNTKTVTDLGGVVIGTASSSGAAGADALPIATGRRNRGLAVLPLRQPRQIGHQLVGRRPPQC